MNHQILTKENIFPALSNESFTFFENFYYFNSIESTNTAAKQIIKDNPGKNSIIIAKTQTNGRGRLSRQWYSPPGGLYISYVIKASSNQNKMTLLPLLCANSIHHFLQSIAIDSQIKWPNDILVNSKKIAGILIENIFDTKQQKYFICGIGINVNNHSTDLPKDVLYPSTSIIEEIHKNSDIIESIIKLTHFFEKQYSLFEQNQMNKIIEIWKNASNTLGKNVTIQQKNKTIHGKAIDVDEDGFLIVKTKSNNYQKITSGDCYY